MIESKRRKRRQGMVGWHHWLYGYEFEQTPEDSEEQGNLVCCSSLGHEETDMAETEQQQAQFVKLYYFMWLDFQSLTWMIPS